MISVVVNWWVIQKALRRRDVLSTKVLRHQAFVLGRGVKHNE